MAILLRDSTLIRVFPQLKAIAPFFGTGRQLQDGYFGEAVEADRIDRPADSARDEDACAAVGFFQATGIGFVADGELNGLHCRKYSEKRPFVFLRDFL